MPSDRSTRTEAAGTHRARRPRLAASSYLNTAPLIWSFQHGKLAGTVELITDRAPARSAELLARRQVDAALVPVIELARLSDVELVPGVCVGACERVRSVVLATDGRDLERVRSVRLDPASRTSVALVRIIFREFFGREPHFTTPALGEDVSYDQTDARLVIGDPAMRIDRGRERVFDLAEVWRCHTNCGFIFAMWMRDRGAAAERSLAHADFAAARDEGLANAGRIIETYRDDVPLADDELLRYLRDNIRYEPDGEMLRGMTLFFRLAHEHGLVERFPAASLARLEGNPTARRFAV